MRTAAEVVEAVRSGRRGGLARAITLVESERSDHRELAAEVVSELSREPKEAMRLGVSGVPGVGKSTFIDALGASLCERQHRVAVLAVDPSSALSGGSILGDKTRMGRLSAHENAFVRPSPTSGRLGGVARKTRETITLCEAAGYDVVIVETVGVGQSETLVAEMVDLYLVLMLAGAGDSLQGIKRGILELADIVAINKADGDNVEPAKSAASAYANALRLMRGEDVPVTTVSALTGDGVSDLFEMIEGHYASYKIDGTLRARREAQSVRWMWQLVEQSLLHRLRSDPDLRKLGQDMESAVTERRESAWRAAQRIVSRYLGE